LDLSTVDDKDACPFPAAIPNPSGQPELALLHRPLFPGTAPEEKASHAASHEVDLDRESIWISYRPISLEAFQPESRRPVFSSSAGDSDIALGMPQNRLRHSADPHQARLAGRLPRR
jgi:hypothetical protein